MYTSHSLYLFLSLTISLSLTIFPRSSGHSRARPLASDKIQRARNSSHFKPNLTCVSSKCNANTCVYIMLLSALPRGLSF